MITTEEAKDLDAIVKELVLAVEADAIARGTGFISKDWAPDRMNKARSAYNAFVDKITNKDD